MSEMIEQVALAIFRSRYSDSEHLAYWPDRLDELVNGPPFDAEGYRDMARAAIEAMREPSEEMTLCGAEIEPFRETFIGKTAAAIAWRSMIDAVLGKVDA